MIDYPADFTFSRSQISFGNALVPATPLLPLLSLILFFNGSARAQTTDTDPHHDSQIAGIAGKYCDYYTRAPGNESTFDLGSSIRQEMFDDGIEQIRIICPDGFVKIFWIAPATKRKVLNIDSQVNPPLSYTTAMAPLPPPKSSSRLTTAPSPTK